MMILDKRATADGYRPGDVFRRQGVTYRVVALVRRSDGVRRVTESIHGREEWF